MLFSLCCLRQQKPILGESISKKKQSRSAEQYVALHRTNDEKYIESISTKQQRKLFLIGVKIISMQGNSFQTKVIRSRTSPDHNQVKLFTLLHTSLGV